MNAAAAAPANNMMNNAPASAAAGPAARMNGGRRGHAIGSKAQVYHGSAHHTSGGLTRKDLVKNKHGRIVSRKQQKAGRKALKYLTRKGYKAKKGSFKLFSRKH